ncbi:MAG: sugar ABC transporter permease [Chloroherpetonaceae bacterium]|nr:sugar ABC transporter permease [Chthonomonadaceae bacterium]MDW8208986.1 sugar ABC transporter permease [Chloroherpetonaceae bacterium]
MSRMGGSRARREGWTALGFLLPNLLGFLVFTSGPVLFSLAISFSNWNLQQTVPFRWIGVENYAHMLRDTEFWLYTINTFYFLLGLPVSIAGSLFLALLLSQQIRGVVVYRTLFYLPSFTSGVALMILWKSLYNPDFGLINTVIRNVSDAFHLGITPPEWLLSTKNVLGLEVERIGVARAQWGLGARDAIIIMGIWTAIGGNNMLLYLAALTNIPQELIEAGQIDGAGRWALFRHIVWPQLAPTTFFIVVMSFIGGLQGGFEQARVMTGGGPAGTTTTLSYYIYTRAFEEFQIGYASAVSWTLFALIFVLTWINWRFGNREVHY